MSRGAFRAKLEALFGVKVIGTGYSHSVLQLPLYHWVSGFKSGDHYIQLYNITPPVEKVILSWGTVFGVFFRVFWSIYPIFFLYLQTKLSEDLFCFVLGLTNIFSEFSGEFSEFSWIFSSFIIFPDFRSIFQDFEHFTRFFN